MAAAEAPPRAFRFQDPPPRRAPSRAPLPAGARTPARPRERIQDLFRSRQNVAYLATLFTAQLPPGPLRSFALETLEDSVRGFGHGGELLYSDPLALRGAARPAVTLWGEVRRLNLAFFEYRMEFLRDKAALLSGRSGDGQRDEDEQYHFRMLTADSLRPPGLEHLNGAGLHADRSPGASEAGEPGFAGGRPPRRGGLSATGAPAGGGGPQPLDPGVSAEDWGWDDGDADRTPEEALAAYWGEGFVESAVVAGAAGGGPASAPGLDLFGHWREDGGGRAMRYKGIPRWQHTAGALDAVDRDIGETLGAGPLELDNHVRRWGRGRHPPGEEYRRYGPRSGATV